jgi:ankyrin repeat protein
MYKKEIRIMERRDFLRNGLLLGTAGLLPAIKGEAGVHQAIDCTTHSRVDASVEARASVEALDVRLHQAARNADIKRMKALLESDVCIESKDDCMATPIFHAVWSRKPEAVKFLLEHGADVDVFDGCTYPIHFAALYGDVDLMTLLLDNLQRKYPKIFHLHFNSLSNHGGMTPLHHAIASGKPDAVRLLLDRGADVNSHTYRHSHTCCPESKGWSALHHAAHFGNVEIITMLLNEGADVHAKDHNGNIPLDYAVLPETKQFLRKQMDCIKSKLKCYRWFDFSKE